MRSRRRSPPVTARRILLAGAPLVVLWAACAHAQPAGPAQTDGMSPGGLYMDADLVTYDDEGKIATARGGVEVRYEGRTLRAEEVDYDEGRGVVTARGKVAILNADGTSEFAEEMVLDDQMRTGVAIGFSARLQENIKLAGATAIRRSETIQELNRAIYTPCEICTAEGAPKTPTWSIRADKVVQDKKRRLVHYRNAVIQVFGVPVMYMPVFWHADPQAKRSSGFLSPKIGASNRRGFSYEQPYLIVTSPYSDITLSPQINTKVNPFLNVGFRKQFYSGIVEGRIGYTQEQDFDGKGNRFGEDTSRSYILARGAFRLTPEWRWGFTAERVSDDLIFDKYEVGDVYASRGPYVPDDRRLISQLYAVRQDQRSYFSAAALSIQGLRRGGDETTSLDDDNDRTFPTIAPLIEASWEPRTAVLGGRLRLNGAAVALNREQSPLSPVGTRLPGLDSARVTGSADWRAHWTSGGGVRVEPFANVRLDAYRLGDLPVGLDADDSLTRGLAVVGVDVRYPFFRRLDDATVVIEPMVQVAFSPNARQVVVGRTATGEPIYLDEDSQAFEFDETNLFRANKFPGFDLYEDGARLNVGVRGSVLWDDGRRANLLIGRSFRDEDNPVFLARTGLRTKASDWVVAADAQPIRGVTVFTRARLDSEDLSIRRAEAGANVANKYGSGFIRYLRDDLDITGNKRENIDFGGEAYVTKHWGVSAYGNRDLVQNGWVVRDIGLVYRDDCTRFEVIYRREDTIIGRLGPTESIALRLTLATLGGPIYAD